MVEMIQEVNPTAQGPLSLEAAGRMPILGLSNAPIYLQQNAGSCPAELAAKTVQCFGWFCFCSQLLV